MRRLWLLFAQTVTVLLAIWFVFITLKPEWLQRPSAWSGPLSVLQAPANPAGSTSAGSLSLAAKRASPSVVSINTASRKPAQSERMRDGVYADVAQRLLDSGAAYYCYCSTEELEARREQAGHELLVVPGHQAVKGPHGQHDVQADGPRLSRSEPLNT